MDICGSPVKLWDTVGLDEGDKGMVAAKNAITNLYNLLRSLKEGVSLLVYCIRGPRFKESIVKNNQMFYEAFCQENVPIFLVVTGLEEEEDTEDWWLKNKATFQKQHWQMIFRGQACITSTKGELRSGRVYEAEYEESRKVVQKLIRDTSLVEPWKMEMISWPVAVARTSFSGYFSRFYHWSTARYFIKNLKRLEVSRTKKPKQLWKRLRLGLARNRRLDKVDLPLIVCVVSLEL